MDIKEEKKILRKKMREEKKKYSLQQKKDLSLPIFEKIENTDIFQKAKCVLLYWSMDDEVFTHDFINKWYQDKTILLPCVSGDDLILRQYTGTESMKEGEQFAIPEPQGEIFTNYSAIDLMIIPGVAFDADKNRMGRGRGFYDRLLNSADCEKAAVCFDFQLVEKVPAEAFDVKMDRIFSTSHIY